MLQPTLYTLIAICCVALFALAFLSAIERGFTSLSAEAARKLQHLSEKKRTRLINLLSHPHRLRQAIMLYRSLMLIIYAATGIAVALHLWGSEYLILSSAILAITAITIASILPQRLAANYAVSFISHTASFTHFLVKAAHPFTIRTKQNHGGHGEDINITLENLERAIENYDTSGNDGEKDILKSLLRFGDETAGDLMTPRARVFSIDVKEDFTTVLKRVEEENYSRIPICENSPDKIRGILYVKDLLPHLEKPEDFEWQRLVRQPFFIPENKPIRDLLREFKKSRVHIAVVVDEYGAMTGVVTMEDIWEEIFGEIQDEFDDEKSLFIRLGDDDYLVEGETSIADFCNFFNLDEDAARKRSGESDTVAGLVLALCEGFPALHYTTEVYGLKIEVLQMEKRRISQLRVRRVKES